MHVDTNSHMLKVDESFFWVGMVKNGWGQSGHGTLKLTVSQKWTLNELIFLHAAANSGNLKIISWSFGQKWGQKCGQKWAWSFSSWEPKICWMSVWTELIFCVLTVKQ